MSAVDTWRKVCLGIEPGLVYRADTARLGKGCHKPVRKRMLTMLRYQRILLCLALVSVVVWLSGCLIMAGGTKVVNPGATRQKVNFEFEEGQPIFRREFNRRYESGAATVGSDGFAIPFIIAADETKMLFENAFFNVQVDAADVNGDGLISDAEARVYANVQKK